MPDARAAYEARCRRLQQALQHEGAAPPLGLARTTSNLFRDRHEPHKRRLDLGAFDHVLGIDADAGWVDTEAAIDYEALADATLAHRMVPAVVPELKSITVGGAIAGVGIEASSFRHGLVHETVLDFDVLLPDGRIVTCAPDNEASDLFFGIANSYGTLGYLLRARLRTVPAGAGVAIEHRRTHGMEAFLADLDRACADAAAQFVDGVVFAHDDMVLTVAAFRDTVPRVSDYSFEHAYHASLRARPQDWLTARDWLWRWDTDWFWCSRQLGADRDWVRRLLGPKRLNSRTYTRWMRWNARLGLTRRLARLGGMRHVESVIQDVVVPRAEVAGFVDFLLAEIGVLPIWICPLRPAESGRVFPLFPLPAGVAHVNVGFWGTVQRREAHPAGHFNRLVERQAIACGALKSLYSEAYFDRATFDALYGGEAYAALRAKYDPQQRLLDLYAKCVKGA